MTSAAPSLGGMLLIDKPAGLTSHDVVQAVRRKLSVQRIGHTGTLDPAARGLLILLVGPATKFQQAFQGHEKVYEAVVRLGTQTDTGDATGAVVRTAPVPPLAEASVAQMLSSLEGTQLQTPPAYSAVKVRGRPAYWWARHQQPVTLSTRTIHLSSVRLIACAADTITIRVHCSAGTYVRVLAELIAERLGTVGHLAGLIRLQVGTWTLDQARTWEWIQHADSHTLARELRTVPTRN